MMPAVNCLFIFVIRVIHYRGNFVSHDFSAGLVSFGVFSLTIDLRAINCLFLILLGYRVGSNLYYKYETIIRRSYYYSLPSPSSSSVSVSKSVSPSSKFNCFISAQKTIYNIYTLEIIKFSYH
ncbi:MAG: hypothetical protein K0S67_1994 [Nitrososphaeraceae archaeon]|nr:hypothetical protein [Nitrososphaeraceae archaeon]